LCFESTLKLRIDNSREDDHINQVIKEVNDNIMVIKNTFPILSSDFGNCSLKKVKLYLDSVIPFSNKFLSNTETYFMKNTRYLHLIINELNEFSLGSCKPLKYDYIIFGKKEFSISKLNHGFRSEPIHNLKENII